MIHRQTKLGETLVETLKELKQKQILTETKEHKILQSFDNVIS